MTRKQKRLATIAGLGAVENGQAAAGCCHGTRSRHWLAAGLGETVEIAAHPDQLLGIEGRERLVQLTLLFIREGG